ncbi:hypothetical protein [uncultured Duncaniella sp.]|uniref:hypothetical protein n=1 Tax=uncultured Duncaniella sp. TaxID=2768039 RepID=UPI0025A9A8CD|nr:hypothetical protein [uncultured Duncaniella sp.]
MTRVSFSNGVLDISLPTEWSGLTQEELAQVYGLMGHHCISAIPFLVFYMLSRCRVIREVKEDFLCSFTTDSGIEVKCLVSPMELVELLEPLSFLMSPGLHSVRLDYLRGCRAVDALLHGVGFGVYLSIENLYQGFISSGSDEALTAMAGKLYPGLDGTALSTAEKINVLNWIVQLKATLADSFPNFFRPAGQTDSGQTASPLEAMNNEIRILTGGDITKENEILNSDCWRALTELDFKAKEAAALKKFKGK